MQDLFGTLLIYVRDLATVQAIASDRVSDVAEEPPSVRLAMEDATASPFGGTGARSVGMQGQPFLLFCYGNAEDPAGPILARQLAGVVQDALHGAGPIRGSNGAFINRIWADEIGGLLIDPDTKWPYHTVRAIAYAAAQPTT